MASWHSGHYDQEIPDVSKPFSIYCPKGTDLWEKPPSTRRSNAPHIYTIVNPGSFKSAAVTIQGEWTYQYDQGGLCIVIILKDGSRKWMKVGVEMLEGEPFISVVTKDRWADWSLRPLLKPGSGTARLRVEAQKGDCLWVYAIDDDGKKHPVREVTWWGELDADTEVRLGPAAAKPSEEGGELTVNFSDFELETS